jgi:hypothetical protein
MAGAFDSTRTITLEQFEAKPPFGWTTKNAMRGTP